jgi:hypothetical protein
MKSVPIFVWVGVVILADVAILAFMYRLRKGRFKVLQDDRRRFRSLSSLGDIAIDGTGRALVIVSGKKGTTIPFHQIRRFDYGMKTCTALAEEIRRGLDLSDLTGMYRDVKKWFQPSAVLTGGGKTRFYVVGQYEPKEPLSQWWFELQRGLLRTVGLFKDADKVSLSVVKQVQGAFAKHGKPLSLV